MMVAMPEVTYGSHDDSKWRELGPGPQALEDAAFETLALHVGQDPDPTTGAVVPAIYATSTYAQDSVANPRFGYAYGRGANPTRRALESCLAALEGVEHAIAYASGMAAADGVLRTVLRPGNHILIPSDVYGGLFRLVDKVLTGWGIEWTAVDQSDLEAVRKAIIPGRTRLIWCETPTNPLLGIADLRQLADVAHRGEALLVVDNTLASPYLQQPIEHGADVVVHSATKYLGGHSDLLGGAVMTADADLAAALRFNQNNTGAVPSAFDAWLILRGVKTLAVRLDRQCQTAATIAERLVRHDAVERVFYPGLPEHPGHDVAAKQMRAFGGMVSFAVRGGEQAALDVCNAARLFTLAESLGAVESLISHPVRMTHVGAAGSTLAPPANVVRLSIGLESARDLIADLERALALSA
jgi:cystathionine gamma-synthase